MILEFRFHGVLRSFSSKVRDSKLRTVNNKPSKLLRISIEVQAMEEKKNGHREKIYF
jgi:hypothetical protein